MPTVSELKGFCAAPWVEAVLHSRGELVTCCRSRRIMGNWQKDGLATIWHNDRFQDFRNAIIHGLYPDEDCFSCHKNGTARSLFSELISPLQVSKQVLFQHFEADWKPINDIEVLFSTFGGGLDDLGILTPYFKALAALTDRPGNPEHVCLALKKLKVIGEITRSWINGDPTPPMVAPFRQVRMIAKCNARCIQCPGGFSGETAYGLGIDPQYIDNAFSHFADIINFFMNGSEFLYYKDWKKIADTLARNGTKLAISTNGILLTKATIEYLVDHQIIHTLNVSMDGASKQTVETIRRNVSYDKLLESIEYIFAYASQRDFDFTLAISFVLMKRNYHEFPDLIKLINSLKKNHPRPHVVIYCQALENFDIKGYADFVLQEHHSLIPSGELTAMINKAKLLSDETGIQVSLFYNTPIKDYLENATLPPPLMVKPHIRRTISDQRPQLETQTGILGLDPLDNVWELGPRANPSDLVTWSLRAHEKDYGKTVNGYLMATVHGRVHVARKAQVPVLSAAAAVLEWQEFEGPMERVILCEEVPVFFPLKIRPWLRFEINLKQLGLDGSEGSIDVYCGYATQNNLSDFTGSAFQLKVGRKEMTDHPAPADLHPAQVETPALRQLQSAA